MKHAAIYQHRLTLHARKVYEAGLTVTLPTGLRKQAKYCPPSQVRYINLKVKFSLCLTKHHATKTYGG
jgi:hypothetical protein